jgi:hypothetical protein
MAIIDSLPAQITVLVVSLALIIGISNVMTLIFIKEESFNLFDAKEIVEALANKPELFEEYRLYQRGLTTGEGINRNSLTEILKIYDKGISDDDDYIAAQGIFGLRILTINILEESTKSEKYNLGNPYTSRTEDNQIDLEPLYDGWEEVLENTVTEGRRQLLHSIAVSHYQIGKWFVVNEDSVRIRHFEPILLRGSNILLEEYGNIPNIYKYQVDELVNYSIKSDSLNGLRQLLQIVNRIHQESYANSSLKPIERSNASGFVSDIINDQWQFVLKRNLGEDRADIREIFTEAAAQAISYLITNQSRWEDESIGSPLGSFVYYLAYTGATANRQSQRETTEVIAQLLIETTVLSEGKINCATELACMKIFSNGDAVDEKLSQLRDAEPKLALGHVTNENQEMTIIAGNRFSTTGPGNTRAPRWPSDANEFIDDLESDIEKVLEVSEEIRSFSRPSEFFTVLPDGIVRLQ